MQHIKDRLKLGAIIAIILLPCMFIADKCKGQSFNGFGTIRIGISEEDFLNGVTPEIKGKIQIITEKNLPKAKEEWMRYLIHENEPQKLYQLKYSRDYVEWPGYSENKSFSLSKHLDSCKIFYLPKYTLGHIKLNDVFIVFKNNQLQLIELDNNEDLLKAAREKYIPTHFMDTAYKIKCVFVVSGVPDEKLVSKTFIDWNYNNLSIEASSGLDYDKECKTVVWGFIRFITKDLDLFLDTNSNSQKKKTIEQEKNKINSLKDKL